MRRWWTIPAFSTVFLLLAAVACGGQAPTATSIAAVSRPTAVSTPAVPTAEPTPVPAPTATSLYSISGTVSESSSGVLRGATVTLEPLGLQTQTSLIPGGSFAFHGVPSGTYALNVSPRCTPFGCYEAMPVDVDDADVVVSIVALPLPTPTPPPTPFPTPQRIQLVTPEMGGDPRDPKLVLSPASLPLQPVGQPFEDPAFGTSLRRVSATTVGGGFETQVYSQLQAFSSDNAYLLLDGSNGIVVRRLDDLGLVEGLDTSEWNAARWHPTEGHVVAHFDTNADTVVRVQFTDLDALVTTTKFTFPGQYQYIRISPSWEEMSEDGRWLAGMLTRDDGVSVIFAVDVENSVLGAELAIPDFYASACEPDPTYGEVEPDWVGVSPLGRYLVVQWARDGTIRCSGLETFDLVTGNFVGRVYDGHQHGDLGIDSDGVTEFFMTVELFSPADNNRPAIAIRELPGTATVSQPVYLQVMDWADVFHISCRGPNGVCLVSWGRLGEANDFPLEDELFLQYTDGPLRRLVHPRSSKCGYWVQPRATISRDGRYVVFASDWGQGTGSNSCGGGNSLGLSDPYLIDLGTGGGARPPAETSVAGVPDIAISVFSVVAAPPPSSIEAALAPNGSFETSILIGNRGDAELLWNLAGQPSVDWLSATPGSGRVAAGNSQSVLVSLDSTGLAPGSYTADLIIGSDDPDEPEVRVPVTMTVMGPPT